MGLAVRGLRVDFGSRAGHRVVAVSDADLTVADGEVLALLGPSGAGKSTLLRAIAGLEIVSAGTVCWDGARLDGVPVHQRRFGLVFQDGQLFPHRDVAGNVAFGLRMQGRRDTAARVAELLELVGLAGFESRRVTELSGGQAQRVALARALAPSPRLLLLDEPLGALDRALRDRLAVDLARLLRSAGGVSGIVVTHDHDEAFTLADRVAIMAAGEIRQVGRPDQVWSRPADEVVAGVLGCERFLDASVAAGVLRCALGAVPISGVPDGPVRVGLRPAALRARSCAVESSAGQRSFCGYVLARLHRGDHVRLTVEVPSLGELDAVAPIAAAPAPGDQVWLTLDPDGIAVLGA